MNSFGTFDDMQRMSIKCAVKLETTNVSRSMGGQSCVNKDVNRAKEKFKSTYVVW